MGTLEIENKRIAVIACATTSHRDFLSALTQKALNSSQIFGAADGVEALHKIQNTPPHILIADIELPRLSGLKLATTLLTDHRYDHTHIILIGPTPNEVAHIEQVLAGRLQFTPDPENESLINSCLTRALNQIAQKTQGEYRLKLVKPGEMLLKEGDKAEFIYIVLKGSLTAQHSRNGKNIRIGQISPGEFVGEMAYINGEPRAADVVAETDSELIEIPISSIDHLLFEKPEWAKALMHTLSKRLKEAIK